jgi:hypothetical protein
MPRGQAQPGAARGPANSVTPSSIFWLAAGVVLLVAVLLRAALLASGAFPFNADEAIVGLMARHILAGQWPTFFYGQAYLGSLDATFVAAAFALVGETVRTIRIVQSALWLATILTTMLLTRQLRFPVLVSAMAGLLLAIPTVNVTLYTTVSLGGYGEAILLGNLILLTTIWLSRRLTTVWGFVLWGALVGFALWVFGLTLVYSVPAGILLAITAYRGLPRRGLWIRVGAAGAGVLLGGLPLILWGAANGAGVLLRELAGSAIAGASPDQVPAAILSHLVNLVLFAPTVILGLRPPWGISPLGMPLAPIAAILWLVTIGLGIRRSAWPSESQAGRTLMLAVPAAVFAGLLLTPFGADPSGRYFLPLAVPLAVITAAGVQAARDRTLRDWPVALAAILLAFNLWTNFEAANREPGFTTQFDSSTIFDRNQDAALAAFLLERREIAGYTTYWVSFPLAFQSQERLVYLPHLPYHSDFRYSARDDRYPPYRARVAAALRPAYITAHQPWLDDFLRARLQSRGVGFEETTIGDYHIFHNLDQTIRPEDLGLGAEAEP